MRGENRLLVFLLVAGVELCYRYAGTNLVTTLLFQRTFPFAEAVGSFLLAAVLAAFSNGRGWRVITVVALYAVGFIPVLWRMSSVFYSWSDSFVNLSWFSATLDRPEQAVDYFVILLVIAWALIFWAGGATLATSQTDYTDICHQFDRGLLIFLALYLMRFYLNATQGLRVEDPVSGWMVFPFIFFSLMAIGIVRNTHGAERDFMPGFQRLGVLLGFTSVIVILGTGLVLFSYPLLTKSAESGSNILRFITSPLVSLLYRVLNWLFGDELIPLEEQSATEQLPITGETWAGPWWLELVLRVITIVVGTLLAIIVLMVLALILYSIVVWLFSKTSQDKRRLSPRAVFIQTVRELSALLRSLVHGLARVFKGYSNIIQIYVLLKGWGRISGIPAHESETPAEYGLRLGRRFPTLERQIDILIQAFNFHVYREASLSDQEMAAARAAWVRLASPRNYPIRARAWLHRSVDLSNSTNGSTSVPRMVSGPRVNT